MFAQSQSQLQQKYDEISEKIQNYESKKKKCDDDESTCLICMEASDTDKIFFTPCACSQWMHSACLQKCLSQKDTCPHCRQAVTGKVSCADIPNELAELERQREKILAQPAFLDARLKLFVWINRFRDARLKLFVWSRRTPRGQVVVQLNEDCQHASCDDSKVLQEARWQELCERMPFPAVHDNINFIKKTLFGLLNSASVNVHKGAKAVLKRFNKDLSPAVDESVKNDEGAASDSDGWVDELENYMLTEFV